MLKNILHMLSISEFYGKSELIEIAKGRNKAPESTKEMIYNAKRRIKWQLRKR